MARLPQGPPVVVAADVLAAGPPPVAMAAGRVCEDGLAKFVDGRVLPRNDVARRPVAPRQPCELGERNALFRE